MPQDIVIRNLTKEDLPEAAEVLYKAFNSVGEVWNRETALRRIEQYFSENSCWAAVISSKIVGIITSKIDNVIDHQELYIDIIAVDPDYQKMKIGTKLLDTAEKYAKDNEYKAVWLLANQKISSFNWYIKSGFETTHWESLTKKLKP